MRAIVELSTSEKQLLRSLTDEEREAVIDQLFERVREDLEWSVAMELANVHTLQPLKPRPPAIPSTAARRPMFARAKSSR
jgi:hypothetical protein